MSDIDRSRERGRVLAAISTAIVGLHAEYYGRGATRARTTPVDDYVSCYMFDIFTPIEKTLIAAGHYDNVQGTRLIFQDIMRERFSEAVEEATGRKVIASFCQIHEDPAMSLESFVLEAARTS
jgi:uncharacterized protein YbcI